MNHRISAQDLILQRSPALADHSFSQPGTFTLQDRVEAISEQSSEEFDEMVSKRIVLSQDNFFSQATRGKNSVFRAFLMHQTLKNRLFFFNRCTQLIAVLIVKT